MTQPETVPNHHAHYGTFAGAFGLIAAISMLFGRGRDAHRALQLSAVTPGATVVDIGCGPGAAARVAAREGVTVIGVDPAPVMLRVARTLTRSGAIRYLEGAAEQLPLGDGAVAGAWSIACVHHWSDVDAGLREVRRVLQPQSRFVAVEHHTRPGAHGHAGHGWTETQAEAFAARCRALGFEDVHVDLHADGRRPAISVTATNA